MHQPHVLFVICDQMQGQRLGTVDPVAYTPHLDRLADESVRFSHCYPANGQCVPSRAAIQTGLYPHEAGVMIIYGFHGHTAHLNGDQTTVGHVFRDHGYTTAYFGKTHFGTSLASLGYAVGADYPAAKPMSGVDRAITDATLGFLADYNPTTPLFLTVSFHEPHPPFELLEEFADHYPPDTMTLPPSYYEDDLQSKPPFQRARMQDREHGDATAEDALKHELRQYYTMISHMDKCFGEVRAALEAKGMWDDTVVVFTSDHGDMMGAHRMRLKGTLPYEEIFRVPLLVRVPDEARPRAVVDDLVVNVSLPGTLIEAAGMTVPPSFRGGSLLPAMRRAHQPDSEEVFFEHYGAYWGLHPFRAIRTQRWKYIKYYGPDRTDELYDMENDPHELLNRAADPALREAKADLERRVDAWWEETGGQSFDYYEADAFKLSGAADLVVNDRERIVGAQATASAGERSNHGHA